ncbi:YheC/YheD family protein [Neobacillus sp. OS1-2]|uniref:YheC/YheD family protein n=1 Tax=Neobacillus sp. OS1-2 TaxID=3070680 RepID=UPI0027DFF8FA|nr:YheC/YheD family protein [Neobacillus sp. OS1-2]WML42354.1 YheC/YheD family protein [Neobacillus sp. OS1-2]
MASSGRIGQYRILHSEKKLSKHLLETELFSKASLFTFLEKYKAIVIKPAFGRGEICISTEHNHYKIFSMAKLTVLMNKEDLYQHLVRHELTEKHHIIQPGKSQSCFLKSPFQYFVTVHRKLPSAEWLYVSKTEKIRSVTGKYFYMYFFKKIESIAILAAERLGESFPECNTIVIEIAYDLKGGIWIQDTVLHFPKSKWSQFNTLNINSTLSSFLPNTDLFSKVTLSHFLQKYNDVIIKPCVGQEGRGILKVTSDNQLTYAIYVGRKKILKANFEETYHFIEEQLLPRKYYIVQQTLPLASIDGCPLDVRVIVQTYDSTWHVTGKIVKVAAQDFFVTNIAQKLLSLEEAIRDANILNKNKETLESEMEATCITAACQLEANLPGKNIIGFDIGFTPQGDIWIIEGNYHPNLSMFYRLEDRDMYMNILRAKRMRGISISD